MKLKYSARPAGYPVRDIVQIGFQIYRRLSGTTEMNLDGEGNLKIKVPVTWQEKIHTDEFHTLLNGQHTINLEAQFQLDVPAATPEQIRQSLKCGTPVYNLETALEVQKESRL